MKLLFLSFLFILNYVYAEEFNFKGTGKLTRNEITAFPNGGKFVSFKHEGGFESNINKYGRYQCNGSILYNKKDALENMFFACKFKDQNGEGFISMGKRKKGSDIDRTVGQSTIIDGEGFWKKYLGYKCTYSIVYVEEIVFSPVKCKK